jgi:hypothetical protein
MEGKMKLTFDGTVGLITAKLKDNSQSFLILKKFAGTGVIGEPLPESEVTIGEMIDLDAWDENTCVLEFNNTNSIDVLMGMLHKCKCHLLERESCGPEN